MNFSISDAQITISENVTGLDCSWGVKPCYVQCEHLNTTLSSLANETICILNNNSLFLTFKLNESKTTCTVTTCRKADIIAKMGNITNQKVLQDLSKLVKVKNSCETVFNELDVLKEYINIERQCILEIIRLEFTENTKNYDFGDFAITVIKINTTANYSDYIKVAAAQFAGLNVHTWIPLEPFLNVSELQSKVGVVTYASGKQFAISQAVNILSPVIRVEVAEGKIENLTHQLKINFSLIDSSLKNLNMSCQYYDDITGYVWKEQNPQIIDREGDYVICSYDHMTPFAVLLVDLKIDKKNYEILSYLTYVGCGLSALFSAASIFLFALKKAPNTDYSNSIHVSLSGALFLLNVSFMLNEIAVTWSNGLCVFVAVTIQYSLLCCFSWMAIEALHLYLLLVKVFNTYIRHYMIKLSLFGWGVPAIIVGLSLCVYNIKSFYGTKNMTFTDTTEIAQICWITDNTFFYGLNLTYFTFMFLMNTGVLATVTSQICRLRNMGRRNKKLPSCKDTCTVLFLSCLLGLTWGFAFFISGYINYPLLYLFCICNSLQGFFMFLWVYRTIRRNRSLAEQSLSPSDPYSSSTSKTKNSNNSEFSHHS
ncbi:adhesion G-protein coupled receptor G2 [Astyanax mexicanus]|uniref:adhesion G-protein coupled receptor G2 n=1 Tax=Astyanax mexicanus TaxID=7994 RepID=UPI0020CB2A4C|nr:adhesion G-protein coupled receptor G2 [Astyanax mexicanus]